MSSIKDDKMRKYWENMMSNKCYTKGIFDSNTKSKVLATRVENYFGPDSCYFDFVKNLPSGTCYVDCE